MTRLAIITDAWYPQINGVVRTLNTTIEHLPAYYTVQVIHPDMFTNVPAPGYNEIRLSIPKGLGTMLDNYDPDHIHVATEGPLGWAAVLWCRRRGRAYTTSYHTQFPEYLSNNYRIPTKLTYAVLRWFHSKASAVMVNSPSMMDRLAAKGFKNLKPWSRGVDAEKFSPTGSRRMDLVGLKKPILMNVGRVSSEKNLAALYELKHTGTIVQVGGGPQLEEYRAKYPHVVFMGPLEGDELAEAYRSADVFVFPSKTDTFGLVMIEAMASGVPVAAYPVTGPIDIVKNSISGYLNEDLQVAVDNCLKYTFSIKQIVAEAHAYTWEKCTEQFKNNLV